MRHRRLGRMSIYANIGLFPNFFYNYTNIRWHFCLHHSHHETFMKFWDFLNYFKKIIIYLCNRSWKVNAKLACILYENEIKAIILIIIYQFLGSLQYKYGIFPNWLGGWVWKSHSVLCIQLWFGENSFNWIKKWPNPRFYCCQHFINQNIATTDFQYIWLHFNLWAKVET